VDPAELGFEVPTDGQIAGGDPAYNAEVLRSVLSGDAGRPRDLVVLNAAAGIWLAGAAASLPAALPLAAESIDSGAARDRLDAFVAVTRRLAVGSPV
jgi:anthranilate phosphoribosyltransferase